MEDENLMPSLPECADALLRYKFWKQVGNTAIYISECGGVITISCKGLYFPKPRMCSCPAMRAKYRPAYFRININYRLGKKYVDCSFYPHRAVAEVYLHPKNLFEIEVDHLDGNIKNCHRLNLEYVTHEENIRRAVEARRKKRDAQKQETRNNAQRAKRETTPKGLKQKGGVAK